jgi:pyruvate-ferredoxin/flavodoxin oxidoreductase
MNAVIQLNSGEAPKPMFEPVADKAVRAIMDGNDRARVDFADVRGVQFLQPLFEFSGACGGCGETPYLKVLSQLFGDRLQIANATGCSSIYSGNLPVTPWTKDAAGRGPAWSNSLFEDNAEFGLGFRLSADKHLELAASLLRKLAPMVGEDLARSILDAPQQRESELRAQHARVDALKQKLVTMDDETSRDLLSVIDHLVRRSIRIVGGDGWAYDIGYGGLDHVLATDRDVNMLVLDTEVYSNTGGQASKATPLGAVAKFAAAGKRIARKDLALQAIAYGNVYVAQVAMGANPQHTLLAFREAEAYSGPSLVIAYSHCIAHGFDLRFGMKQQDLATASGFGRSSVSIRPCARSVKDHSGSTRPGPRSRSKIIPITSCAIGRSPAPIQKRLRRCRCRDSKS